MGRPGDAARMAKMRTRRAPFTDARDGRLKRKVRRAFLWSGGKPLTTTELVKQCYWSLNFQGEEIKSWHRTNVSRVADCLPFGSVERRAKGDRSCGHHGLS